MSERIDNDKRDAATDDEAGLFEVPAADVTEQMPAADVTEQMPEAVDAPLPPRHGASRRARVVAGCVVAMMVAAAGAACAGAALPPVAPSQEALVAATTAAATSEQADPALTASDVAAMLPSLSFDGNDVSIASDLATVGVSETGNVVVTNASTDDAATVVSSTAMRSAALAGELGGATVAGPSGDVAVSEVTWVTTDPNGNVECGVASDPAKAPTSGTAADVIGASKGWTMSDAAHDAAGLPAELPATGGEPVTDAGGNAVTPSQGVADAAGAAGESGSQAGTATGSDQQHQAAASQRPSGSQPSGGNGGSGSSASSGSGGSTSSQPSAKWVPDQGHYEDVKEQVWMPNVVYTRHERAICSTCGAVFDSFQAFYDHSDAMWDKGEDHGAFVDDSYTTKEDQGHYDTKVTGRRWVVDVPGHWE